MDAAYHPHRAAHSEHVELRTLRCHVLRWGDASLAAAARPPLVLLHGWMDVGASFQFFVDALAAAEGFERLVFAPDWRGFGLTEGPPTDSYWFPDYLGDLDALLDLLAPGTAVDLLGHSMGGNVAMSYAGLRPERVRRLVNLEGFGMPAARPQDAPRRLVQWLDELKAPARLRDYAGLDEVAARLRANNPRLSPERAAWLAPHWARRGADGRWRILGDPAHKRVNPVVYRADEVLEAWKRIAAPVLWAEGDASEVLRHWGERYPRAEFEARLAVVPRLRRLRVADSGHMVHHDQPAPLGQGVADFLRDA